MRAFIVGSFFVSLLVMAPACWEPTCKKPKRGVPNGKAGAREGVLVQCNAVLQCASAKTGPFAQPLTSLEDPQIIDRGSSDANEDLCIEAVKARGVPGICEKVVVTPRVICLDPPGSNGCNAGAGDDGTVVIVGGAASGDHRSDPQGGGAADGQGDRDGVGGQGGR